MRATKKKLALLLALLLLGLTACAALESADVPAGPVDLPVLADEFEAEPAEKPPAEQEAEPASEPDADEVSPPEAATEADAEEAPLPEAEPASDADEEVPPPEAEPAPEDSEDASLPEDGTYTSKEEVALYIHQYGHLPDNFITKKEAEALGWPGGDLEPYAPGKCIGGSRFGNYEGILPAKEGRSYTECDIDTLGKSKRGAKRIVFSNDGLIYYTEDHYESFELLYGEE